MATPERNRDIGENSRVEKKSDQRILSTIEYKEFLKTHGLSLDSVDAMKEEDADSLHDRIKNLGINIDPDYKL